MSDKIKDYSLIIIFAIIIFGTFLMNIVVEDSAVSKSERKALQQFPEISAKTIKDKSFMTKFETYTSDQFVGRDAYRKLKAFVVFNIFRHSDNNDIYIADGHASKYVGKTNENAVNTVIKGYNHVYDTLLKNNDNVYFSIIPDKNYFIAEENGYPSINYEELVKEFNKNLNSEIKYIDLFDSLSIDDYYTTDIHWRQEKINDVVKKLAEEMNFDTGNINYTENVLEGFYGVYYGQSALPLDSEDLIYYTAEEFDGVTVKVLDETVSAQGVAKFDKADMYNLQKYTGADPYDVYLHGPKQLIVIENKNASSNRELVIFRDSFTSSLAPLLVESYAKITLIDLRYIANTFITKEMVDFNKNQDVLILNSIDVLNSGSIKFFDENNMLIK
ncbi:MAG: hypothetical protein IJX99_03725 [Clostridia bacterium]|nr:hypothetical protein [Clostridia bacterium]